MKVLLRSGRQTGDNRDTISTDEIITEIMVAKTSEECMKFINYAIKVIGLFDDKSSSDPETNRQWIQKLRDELRYAGFTDEADAENLRRIASALMKPGTSGSLWIQSAGPVITDIDSLVTSFTGTFCPSSSAFDAQAALQSLCFGQYGEETLEVYFNRYVNLIHRAYGESDAAAQKKYLISFLRGLPTVVTQQLLGQPTDLTARQYLEAAKRIYSVQKAMLHGSGERSGVHKKVHFADSSTIGGKSGGGIANVEMMNTHGTPTTEHHDYVDELLSSKVDEVNAKIKSLEGTVSNLEGLIQTTKDSFEKKIQQGKQQGYGQHYNSQSRKQGGGAYAGFRQNNSNINNNNRNSSGNHQGNDNRCFECNSPEHYANRCPIKKQRLQMMRNIPYHPQQHNLTLTNGFPFGTAPIPQQYSYYGMPYHLSVPPPPIMTLPPMTSNYGAFNSSYTSPHSSFPSPTQSLAVTNLSLPQQAAQPETPINQQQALIPRNPYANGQVLMGNGQGAQGGPSLA